jgi:hypothetical protein
MKAKFLKRNESVKSNKVIVWMEVESKEVFALEKGRTYDIELCDTKLPNMAPSPRGLLLQAQALISQASEGIPERIEGNKLPFSCDKDATGQGKCIVCDFTENRETAPLGHIYCTFYDVYQPIYHNCAAWRSREEDKADKIADDSQEKAGVREGVDGKEPNEQGISEYDGS